jgi:hypothetical protein
MQIDTLFDIRKAITMKLNQQKYDLTNDMCLLFYTSIHFFFLEKYMIDVNRVSIICKFVVSFDVIHSFQCQEFFSVEQLSAVILFCLDWIIALWITTSWIKILILGQNISYRLGTCTCICFNKKQIFFPAPECEKS